MTGSAMCWQLDRRRSRFRVALVICCSKRRGVRRAISVLLREDVVEVTCDLFVSRFTKADASTRYCNKKTLHNRDNKVAIRKNKKE
jgi:hypothetical protein